MMRQKWWYWLGLAGLLSLAEMDSANTGGPLPVTSLPLEPALTAPAPATPGLRTFSAGGHVLGFGPNYLLTASGSHALKVEFLNAHEVTPQSDTPEGDTQSQQAPPLTEVRYPGLWDGIDLSYRAAPGGIAESLYALQPGADIGQVRLRYNRPLRLNADGRLSIRFDSGSLIESAPRAWQERNGERQPVSVAFVQHNERELGFVLGEHDPSRLLWIDPTLSWNTFLGGGFNTRASGIAVDGYGNIYVIGGSDSTWGNPVRAFSSGGGNDDAFVAKLDSNGTLLWNTFLGGVSSDDSSGIAVDTSSHVYVTGNSFGTWGSPLRAFRGGNVDAFLAKLDTDGALLWNTFLGGNGCNDFAPGIAVDGSGNVYVSGFSGEDHVIWRNHYCTWGSPLRTISNDGAGYGDAFVAKLDPDGALLWNTFLGGSSWDAGHGIAVDGSGNVLVTGQSYTTWGSPLRAFSNDGKGYEDAFVTKLDTNGALLWSTFLGGNGDDDGDGIAVDASGNIYVAGRSYSATWGSPLQAFRDGSVNAFVAKLAPDGVLLWNTFCLDSSVYVYGGPGYPIAVDGGGHVYVTGNGGSAQLDTNGALLRNTFLGSDDPHSGHAIAVDGHSNVYVTGESNYTWGTPVRSFSFGTCGKWPYEYTCYDAFVAKLSVLTSTSSTDFDGDGQADILWRNSVTGENWLYRMDGTNILQSAPVHSVPDQNWKIAGVADFDGDGQADILWRNSATGENWMYLMNGANLAESHPVNSVPDQNWKIAGVADFDGNGKADILWRNSATGENWLYLMDGPTIRTSTSINTVSDLNWKIVGAADFDGDGFADILWRNSATGQNWLYRMYGASILESSPINTVSDLNWKIAGVGDFDADGQADILWRNSATGQNWLYLMDGATIQGSQPINTVSNLNWKIVGVGDFDADGQADILWRNSATGENWMYLMDGSAILQSLHVNTVADLNWQIQGGGF